MDHPIRSQQPVECQSIFESVYHRLHKLLVTQAQRAKYSTSSGAVFINPSVDTHYHGIWPDDSLYPLLLVPDLMIEDELDSMLAFLTDSVVDLPYLPDRVEPDGTPILSPGMYDSPHTDRMPLHLPAAWVRLLQHCESRGVSIRRKGDWWRLVRRSYDRVPFSCGLVYVDPQRPCVGYGFHDGVAITGCELMCSLIHYRGLERAAKLFAEVGDRDVLKYWTEMSGRIHKNLPRLFDPAIGGLVAGSRDCRQFSVWANGLAYELMDESRRTAIVEFLLAHRQHIFVRGCTRQIAEPAGWQRMLTPSTLGEYMNGGAWPTGTGYVLPAIAAADPRLATEILLDLVETVESFGSPEWLDGRGAARGARHFNASIALPMLGLKSILSGTPLIDFF